MPTNDIKPFASAGGANVLTQAEYLALAALSTGFSSGKASSKEVNKAIRQATFIASVLAQFICDKSGSDVLDDGNVAGLVTKLISAMNKTSQPLDATLTALAGLVGAANKLPYFNGDDTAALTDLTSVGRDIIGKTDIATVLQYLGLQTIKPDPVSTKIFSPDLKKFLLVSNTSWGMWNNDTGAAIALPVSQGGTGQTTVDGVKTAFGIDKLQPKGNYVITDASTKQSLSDALSCRYGLEVTDSNNIARVGIYSANNQATITGINGKAIIIPDKAGTMALAGESVSALRLSAPREVTVTTADAWMNFAATEMVVGIYITPTPGGGAWVLNKVKVATLQANINGAWVNVTQ
ncbi:hypothetical protein [Escherichia coli]|uniref:hypothetical protein n=1 Tax=Escherichia coli TaxID=562 RepID=UPI000B7AF262|nr:hypothetical protein [Escherichia coli]EIA6527221.1 hypothetical protein [Escherichia coli]OXL04247.1 hypothetical protein CD806_02550 [Escherichia coli]HAJ8823718.1 hypothetical protein [Escherichia coli]